MNVRCICLVALAFCTPGAYATAILVPLGTADPFGVLGGSTVTNTGATNVHGDLGVWAGTSITGFGPGILTGGSIHAGDAVAMQAQSDLTTAYNFAAGEACDNTLSSDLGGLTLTPGVYCFTSSAQLTGILTLNGLGNPNANFLFKIGSTLTTGTGSSVLLINGNDTVFWQVGSSATLGTATQFAGNILALSSITLNTGANITCGRALARNGAVTLDTNDVSNSCAAAPGAVPEPGTAPLLGMGLLLGLAGYFWQSRRQAA